MAPGRETVSGYRTDPPEYRYGNSRIDFCVETKEKHVLIEVKGVTLKEGETARFPDAPSERAVKHLEELIHAVEEDGRLTSFLSFR